ncbi:CHAT domain-containing protein [Promicromonospora vindobonensis]|uniref:CHAT domain-containing protein n=1 Tax=Promicromonospora vindobonensis TaxID=195748 RepID=A0ABW5W0E5_9MICO
MSRVDWDLLERRYTAARTLNDQNQPVGALTAFRVLVADLAVADARSEREVEQRSRLMVRSQLGLALATYECSMDGEATTSALDRAATEAEAAPESIRRGLVGLVSGQRGVILLRSGQFVASLAPISASLAAHDPDDLRSRAIDHLNRGFALMQVGRIAESLKDHESAHQYAEADGNTRTQSFALHNIGYVRHLLGDLPGALIAMEKALEVRPDGSTAIDMLGRAEALFEGGLVAAADQLLTETIPQLKASRLRPERAEAEYYRARCLLILRRFDDAQTLAARSRQHFEAVGYIPRAVLSRVLELEAALAAGRRSDRLARATARRRAAQALSAVVEGDAAGPVLGQHPGHAARLVAAHWLVLAGNLDAARETLQELPRGLKSAPLTMRIQHYTVQAELAFAEGNRPRGLRAVRSGARLLAGHRSRLGSVESVTAAAAHGEDLTRVDVETAVATGRPAAIFDALERGRATFAGAGRVTPPEDPEAAALLTEARGLLAKARELGASEAKERERLTHRARRIQDQVRKRSWRHAGNGSAVQSPVTAREMHRVLAARDGDSVVANFVNIGGRLRCVRVDSQGVTAIEIGPVEDVTERVRRLGADFAMAANDLIPAPLRAAANSSLARNLKLLDTILLAPLRADGDLYVVARAPLLSVPWTALPSRSGLRTAVNSYVARGRTHARPSGKRRLLAAAGPGVKHGTEEAHAVGRQWAGATVLTGEHAVTEHVRTALATHDVVHLATHGQHDADNPLFASIDLADGPLFAHELDGTPLPGSVVILSSCEVGGSTQVLGGEVLGLTSVLLRLGARAVIASVAKLSDELAARVMPRLHAHLRDTDDPEAALAAALKDVAEPVPLVCFSSVEGLAVG